jgi:hypothetical protein
MRHGIWRNPFQRNDAVLDEPLAGFLHLLVFFFRLQEFPRVAYRDSARKAVGEVV